MRSSRIIEPNIVATRSGQLSDRRSDKNPFRGVQKPTLVILSSLSFNKSNLKLVLLLSAKLTGPVKPLNFVVEM